jgi:hypothetical protein
MARVVFNESDARRIAAATRAYERGNRDMPPIKFRQVGDDDGGARLGKIDETWTKGSELTVQEYDGNGTIISASTFLAVNRFADVVVGSGQEAWVCCILIGAKWHLIAAECAEAS